MGFGTLFVGYFLLLNISYYGFTDIICALVMTFALYKLSPINQGFKRASWVGMAFAVFALFELVLAAIDMFFPSVELGALVSSVGMARSFTVCILTVFMLIGMRDICREVELSNLSVRCNRAIFVTFAVYSLNIIWQTSDLFGNFNVQLVLIVGILIILATLLLVSVNLISIYGCYMNICMPNEQKKSKENEKSRFGFVNRFREHEEEKQREYAEYRLNKFIARQEKKKKNRKK